MSTDQELEKLSGFLARKNIVVSVRRYLIEAMGAMTLGLFASLLIGTIIKTLGQQLSVQWLADFGGIAQASMGPAIAVAVAFGLKSPPLVLFSSAAVGAAAVSAGGGPAGCYVAAIFGAEFGKLVSKETKVDILLTPAVTLIVGVATAIFVGPGIGSFMVRLGGVIMWATEMQPIPMGILVSVVMGLALTSPLSSAAIAVMLGLSGLAAGAATVGCCCQMVGFAAVSYRENGIGGVLAQGLGTSMIQVPNIILHPLILVPPTLASAILGPVVTTIIPMENNSIGAGMGSSGLVGQISTLTVMGGGVSIWLKILSMQFILPAGVCLIISEFMRKKGWIKFGDLKLDV